MIDVSEDLAERIADRRQEAEEKEVYRKTGTVARILGEKDYRGAPNVSYEFLYTPEDARYPRITTWEMVDERPHRVTVSTAMQDIVFQYEDGEITAYRPGEWEDEIEQLYEEAQRELDAEEAENWGIEL